MLKKLRSVFYFYQGFLLPSLFLNFLLVLFKIEFFISFIFKIVFFALLIYGIYNTRQKDKLTFYQNLSIGAVFLFGMSLLMDLLLLTIVYLIFGDVYRN